MTTPPRPPEIEKTRMKAIGKASQILPAYLRMICRSRIDCTPIEVLDQARKIALSDLRIAQQTLPDYQFIKEHTAIASQYTPDQLLDLIADEIDRQTPKNPYITNTCRMMDRGTGSKKACWICPIIPASLRRCRPAFID